MFMLCFAGLVYTHVSKETQQKMTAAQKRVFENLVVGVNVRSLECYERVANAVLNIPPLQIRNISRETFVTRFLREDFIDPSGKLI